jgi:hypothetical protein
LVVDVLEPGRYRSGVETISRIQRSLEGGGFDGEMTVSTDAVVHAEWIPWSPYRPPARLYATTSK